jgi:hypothetical protein
MYIFTTPHDTTGYDSGTCRDLVYYYEKENDIAEDGSKEMFFDSDRDDISASEVIDGIDGNYKGKGLKTRDAKFYNVFINPSRDELRHIGNDPNKLKDYARDVMKEYADTFNRIGKNGEKVTVDDFVWYGKLEKKRYFKADNKIVKHNEAYAKILKDSATANDTEKQNILREKLAGMAGVYVIEEDKTIVQRKGEALPSDTVIKRGMPRPEEHQNHVHIIVSRCHKTERRSFSPMSNARSSKNTLNGQKVQIGFNRIEFAKRGEVLFDCKFDYGRKFDKSYVFNGNSRNRIGKKKGTIRGLKPESTDYYAVLVNGKLLDMQAKSLNTGINQLSVLIYRSSEDRKGVAETLDRFAEKFHPGFIRQRIEQQYDAIKSLQFLDRFAVGNLPALMLKKGVETAVKPLTKSFIL